MVSLQSKFNVMKEKDWVLLKIDKTHLSIAMSTTNIQRDNCSLIHEQMTNELIDLNESVKD